MAVRKVLGYLDAEWNQVSEQVVAFLSCLLLRQDVQNPLREKLVVGAAFLILHAEHQQAAR